MTEQEHRAEVERLSELLTKLLADPDAWNASGWWLAYACLVTAFAALWKWEKKI